MKTINLQVSLTFSDDLHSIKELVESVADNLRADAETAGIVSDSDDVYTLRIAVKHGPCVAVRTIPS